MAKWAKCEQLNNWWALLFSPKVVYGQSAVNQDIGSRSYLLVLCTKQYRPEPLWNERLATAARTSPAPNNVIVVAMGENRVPAVLLHVHVCSEKKRISHHASWSTWWTNRTERTNMTEAYGIRRKRLLGVSPKKHRITPFTFLNCRGVYSPLKTLQQAPFPPSPLFPFPRHPSSLPFRPPSVGLSVNVIPGKLLKSWMPVGEF